MPREGIVPPCAENRRGFSPSLAPRKGHFSSSPWHRHGKTVPKKEPALKGHPNMPGPSERVASSWDALAGLNVLKRINPTALPWAASGLPLRGGNTPIIIESWYKNPLLRRFRSSGVPRKAQAFCRRSTACLSGADLARECSKRHRANIGTPRGPGGAPTAPPTCRVRQ